jgi:hypothetical protein
MGGAHEKLTEPNSWQGHNSGREPREPAESASPESSDLSDVQPRADCEQFCKEFSLPYRSSAKY